MNFIKLTKEELDKAIERMREILNSEIEINKLRNYVMLELLEEVIKDD